MQWIENGIVCIGTAEEFRTLHPAIAPKIDTPKVDTPKVDTPKVDTPKDRKPRPDKGRSRKYMILTNECTLYMTGAKKVYNWYKETTREEISYANFRKRLTNGFDFGYGIAIERMSKTVA